MQRYNERGKEKSKLRKVGEDCKYEDFTHCEKGEGQRDRERQSAVRLNLELNENSRHGV